MPLVSAAQVLPQARRRGYAVGAFSIHTPEMVDAVFAAGERLQSPLILQVGRRAVQQSGVEEACAWVRRRAARSPVPAVLHLDHALDLGAILRGLRAGCTSVMYDGSDLPLEENVRRTSEIVATCHAVDVPVEAEVGRMSGVEDDLTVEEAEGRLATAELCVRFVQETGCDVLAPAVGSVHGLGQGVPHLRLDLLTSIAAVVDLPLVLHGGSGLDPQQLAGAIRAGVAKVNVDTELRRTFVQALGQALEVFAPRDDPRPALLAAESAVAEQVALRIGHFGSAGHARD